MTSSYDPTAWRHTLHQLAETAHNEQRTAAFVADTLTSLGLEVTTGIGGNGVVGTLSRGDSTTIIGLRTEMDALPLTEQTALPFASRTPGTMHACGHDGHMAMVLGAAATLAEDSSYRGTIRFLFQPAEEPGKGAAAMLDDGLLDRFPIHALFGLHNTPGLAAGHFATRTGAIMAGEDNFVITVTGRGGHASAPHLVIDPLVVASNIVLALQSIVARTVDPLESAVVSCTDIRTDGSRNAIPTKVVVTGDTRSFDRTMSDLLERRIRAISTATAEGYGATAEVEYTREFANTTNDSAATARAVRAAVETAGKGSVDESSAPIMASEDFGLYANLIPANFTFIGNGATGEHGGIPLHSHDYQFNDAVLPVGIRYYTQLAHAAQ